MFMRKLYFIIGVLLAIALLWWLAGKANPGFFYLDALPLAHAAEQSLPILYVCDSIGWDIKTDSPRLCYPGMSTRQIRSLVSLAPDVRCRYVVLITGTNDLLTDEPEQILNQEIALLSNACGEKFKAPVFIVSPWVVRSLAKTHSSDGIHLNPEGRQRLIEMYPCLVDNAH